MIRPPLFGVVVAAWLIAGCATMNVSSHVERGINFPQFATYDWAPADALPTGDPRLDNNPFFLDYLTGAVDRQLAARGYRRATDGRAQLLVHYHANVSQRFEVHGIEPNNYPNCYPNCEPSTVEYEQGTLMLDLVDAASGKLVWRAWAQEDVRGLIDDQDAMQRHIERAVVRMFERFPVGTDPAAAK